jgi:hypothetical protein
MGKASTRPVLVDLEDIGPVGATDIEVQGLAGRRVAVMRRGVEPGPDLFVGPHVDRGDIDVLQEKRKTVRFVGL